MNTPILEFPHEVEEILRNHPRGKRDALLAWFQQRLAPVVVFASTRVSERPLTVGAMSRLFGRKPPVPTLSVTASKFGGTPYLERSSEWPSPDRGTVGFLGQINFADLGSAHVEPLPKRGLLVMYDWRESETLNATSPLFIRWYPSPDSMLAVEQPVKGASSRAQYETSLFFQRTWMLPQSFEWETELFEENDEALTDAILEWNPELPIEPPPRPNVNASGEAGYHSLLGDGLSPDSGGPALKPDERILLRLDNDNEAGFRWGSSAVFIVIQREDLEAHRLDKARSTVGNL